MSEEPVIKVRHSCVLRLFTVRDFPDGDLFAAEAGRQIPFEIKRTYFITNFGPSKAVRGRHAHRQLDQAIFCLHGAFTLGLDDGEARQMIRLSKPDFGVRLGPMLWHTMEDFSPDCVIAVLASAPYHEADYIRSYADFKAEVGRSPAAAT